MVEMKSPCSDTPITTLPPYHGVSHIYARGQHYIGNATPLLGGVGSKVENPEIDPIQQELNRAHETHSEAKAAREAYSKFRQPYLDERDQFSQALWNQIYPEGRSGSLKGHSSELIEAARSAGLFERLDQLNQAIAPMSKEFAILKAAERDAERTLERLEWEFGKVCEAKARRSGRPKKQGELF